jgi:hypothetical protein
MAYLGMNFDATQVAPSTSLGPIPAGNYVAQIIESDVQPLKSGNGTGLKLVFEVIDGEHKGRKVIERLNIQHTNAQTQQIAQSQLSALCHAVGAHQVQDSAALHFKPVKIVVAVRPAQGEYGPQNNIKGFESSGGGARPAFSAPAQPAANSAAPAGAPAWAKKAA